MTWMSLPSDTGKDKYVHPDQGNDSNNGNSWGSPYRTCSRAASQSGAQGRIWLAPGNHDISSTVVYEQKQLHWIGPPIPGFRNTPTGAAFITGSGLNRYFDSRPAPTGQGNVYGGGFYNIVFDMQGINIGGEAVLFRQGNYIQLENLYGIATSGTYRANYVIRDAESNYAEQAAKQDRSWWTVKNVRAQNCGLMKRDDNPGRRGRGMNGAALYNCEGFTDDPNGATQPYWWQHSETHFRGAFIGGHFTNTAPNVPALLHDQRNTNQNPTFNLIGTTFSDLSAPYHGLEVYQAHIFIAFPGSNGTTGGLIWGDADCDGFVAVPKSALATDSNATYAGTGSLRNWPNYPYKNGDGSF